METRPINNNPAMSEQPPVGDNVVLGLGGTFKVPERFFEGWSWDTTEDEPKWVSSQGQCWAGCDSDRIYAAPRSSEVARLNGLDKPALIHLCNGGDYKFTNAQIVSGNGGILFEDWVNFGPFVYCSVPPAVHGEGGGTEECQRWDSFSEYYVTRFGKSPDFQLERDREMFYAFDHGSADKDALIRVLVEALKSAKNHKYSDGTIHHQTFDEKLVEAALRQAEQGRGHG